MDILEELQILNYQNMFPPTAAPPPPPSPPPHPAIPPKLQGSDFQGQAAATCATSCSASL